VQPAATRNVALRGIALALVAAAMAGCLPATLAGRGVASAAPAPSSAPAVTPSPMTAVDLPPASPGTIETLPPETSAPTPTPKPKPARVPVNVNLVSHPASHFITEVQKTWCAAAGTQMVLALNGKIALTKTAQSQVMKSSQKYWSYADSHNRGWGPLMIAKVLKAYGVPGYVVRTYKSRSAALLDAARAIEKTHQPVLLMVWWGAHTWVATGFRATADPLVFSNAKVTGMYVLDPWYPRISSIWGPSDPPGTFQDTKEMVRNYIRWTRPEGRYPARDGLFVAVVPTLRKP
jgi:hypothetical protein